MVLPQQTLHRRGRNHRDVNRPFSCGILDCDLSLLLRDVLIADLHVEHSDDGIFADSSFRNVEFELPGLLRKPGQRRFVALHGFRVVFFRRVALRLGSFGHLGGRIVVIEVVIQFLNPVAILFKMLNHRIGRIAYRGKVRLQQLQGLLHEVFVVLAHHAAPVLAACTSVRTFILEKDLVGCIVMAGVAFGLVETVGIQARHVAIVEPSGNLPDPGILPRQAAAVREMLFIDLLLDRRIVFRDLGGDTDRNLLPVELFGEGVDQITEFQPGADVALGFPELPDQALDRMTARFQRPFVGRSLLTGCHVLALEILRNGGILGFGIRQLTDKGRNEFQPRHRCGPIAPFAIDNLKTFLFGPDANRLQNPDLADAVGEFLQGLRTEILAGIVGAADNFVQIQQLNGRSELLVLSLGRERSLRQFLHVGIRIRSRGFRCFGLALLRFLFSFGSLHNIKQFLPCVSRFCGHAIQTDCIVNE